MRQDNAGAGPPFAASPHWQEVVQVFEGVFRREGIKNPEEQCFNLCFSGFALGDARLHRYVCWMYRRILQQRDALNLLNKLRATCGKARGFGYEMEDEYLSLDLLFSIDDFYNLYELNPAIATQPMVVVELGAGWGRLGYVLRLANPRSVYVVMDLPEVLLVSQTYLPRLLPNDTVADYSHTRQVVRFTRDILLQKQLWFAGPQQITRFDRGAVDIAVNIGSFQEMPVNYVDEYLRHFSFLAGGGYCYLRQLRDGASHGHHLGEIPGLSQYPFPATWEKRYLRSSVLSDEFFEAGFSIK